MPPDTLARDDLRRVEAGLDRLQTDAPAATPGWRRFAAAALPPALFVAALLIVWVLAVQLFGLGPDTLPPPSAVLGALGAAWESGLLVQAIATSLGRALIGFAIAIAVGTVLGLLLAEVRPLRRAIGPVISGLMVLPSVAWVPAATLWFGLTDALVYFVVLMGGVPSIVNGLISGVDQVPPQLRRVGRVLGASRLRLATTVILPAALPGYLAGLKQGWAFSWRGVLAAEIIAAGTGLAGGVGALLQEHRQAEDMAGVLAAILVILLIGIVVELAILAPIERGVLRRRGLNPGGAR
ncbi:ABC transporter permease [Microbacterium sp. HD4P20]|uniref:ABC transporter permease n=1 Tax=Microbacterium sp. HD4P20 TaxID=2864874 RepID=UPI001C6428DC|nr:ABC transporter permease [Microbacterium sp. HD4P20]MCP2638186.1 ABC transporter permease [Microbacterium sp. HD4P20]